MLIDVGNHSVVGAFNRGCTSNRETHALLLIQLSELQVEYGFMLSLKWIPTAENGVEDAISRPSRDAIIHIAPAAFKVLWTEIGPFNVNLIACTASVLRSPLGGEALSFFSQYDCAASSGADMFAQDILIVPGTRVPAFGFCFPPPIIAGHNLQHMQGSCGYPLARCEGVWVPFVAARLGKVYRGGPCGRGRVLSVAQC